MRLIFKCYVSGAIMLWAPVAHAQSGAANPDEPATADDGSLAEIVVTAQKRSENLQDVPIAISAIQAGNLLSAGVETTQELQFLVPTLLYSQQGAYGQPYLRGIGSDVAFINGDPSVVTYVDGVYVATSGAVIQQLLGVDRVEVLSGPQGTLYGRNAVAGAINVYTKTPSNEIDAEVSASYGNYDSTVLNGYLSGPVSDNLYVGIYGGYDRRDTFVDKVVGNLPEPDHESKYGGRVKVVWDAGSGVKLTGSVEHVRTTSFEESAFRNIQPDALAYAFLPAPEPIRKYQYFASAPQLNRTKQTGLTLREEVDLGWAKILGITGFRKFAGFTSDDVDATTADVLAADAYQTSKQFSQEVQLISPDSSSIDWIVGAYYFTGKAAFDPVRISSPLFFGPSVGSIQTVDSEKLVSTAAFAQVTAPLEFLSPNLRLTIGGRYTIDRKKFEGFRYLGVPFTTPFPDNTVVPGSLIQFPRDRRTWRRFTPKATLDYTTGNTLVYATFSRGYKAGLFNLSDANAFGPVNPESLTAYEVGVKSEFLERKIRLNAAAYFYDYKNLQVSQTGGNGGGIVPFLQNAATAKAYGVEATLTVAATRELTLRASAAWEHTEFTSFPNAASFLIGPSGNLNQEIDATGERLPRAPKWVASGGFDYRVDLGGGGKLLASADAYYNSGFTWVVGTGIREPSYFLLNATVGYLFPGEKLSLTAFGTNLTDKHYAVNKLITPVSIAVRDAAPRMYGIRLRWRY
jgi:iron complex outermembrane recepter protein